MKIKALSRNPKNFIKIVLLFVVSKLISFIQLPFNYYVSEGIAVAFELISVVAFVLIVVNIFYYL